MRKFLLALVVCPAVFAQSPLIVGVRGGLGLTDNLGGVASGLTSGLGGREYLVGPTAGVRLGQGFSVEGDALFHRQTLGFGNLIGVNALNVHADSWQFPVMLKYTAGDHSVAPVLGGGVSVRRINELGNIPSYLLSGTTKSTSVGFVIGGGLRFRTGPVSITPEVRYTRWNSSGLAESLLTSLLGNRNQAEAMVGFTF